MAKHRTTMAAYEQLFTDPVPPEIYLDTDIVLASIIRTEPHYLPTRTFIERLASVGRTDVYVSSLLWLEFANVLTREQFRQRLTDDTRQRFRLDRWQEVEVRRTYLRYFDAELTALLMPFTWYEVAFSPDVRGLAANNLATYAMRSHDAAHLASAQYAGVTQFASLDESFRRVDGLHLWNNRIHG